MPGSYELVLVLKKEAANWDEKKVRELAQKYLKEKSKIVAATSLGKKQLAYPLKKEKEGVYWILILEGIGKEVNKQVAKLKINEMILRHLLLRKE